MTHNAGQLLAASATAANGPSASVLLQTGQVLRLNSSSATAKLFSR